MWDSSDVARLEAEVRLANASAARAWAQCASLRAGVQRLVEHQANHKIPMPLYYIENELLAGNAGEPILAALAQAEEALLDFLSTRTTHGEANFDLNLGETTRKVQKALDTIWALGIPK